MSSENQHTSPGYDTTPPASRRMLEVAVLVTVILIVLVPLFRSYFKRSIESEFFGEQKFGVVGVKTRAEIEAEQRARLTAAPLSVQDAAKMLGTSGRGGVPAIAPEASDDLGALEGWTLAKNEAAVEAAQKAVEEAAASEAADDGETEGEAAEGEEEAAPAE